MDLGDGVRAGVAPARRWLSALLVGVVVLTGMSSCGGLVLPANDGAPEATSSDASPSVSESAPGRPQMRSKVISFVDREEGTHLARVTIYLGKLQKAVNGVEFGAARLGGACQFDAERDAVVPFGVRLTSVAPEKALPGEVAWLLNRGSQGLPGRFSMELGYLDPKCVSGTRNVLASFRVAQIPPQATYALEGLIVIPNYFSPERPDGDPDVVKDVVLEVKYVELGPARNMEVAGIPTRDAASIPLVLA